MTLKQRKVNKKSIKSKKKIKNTKIKKKSIKSQEKVKKKLKKIRVTQIGVTNRDP